MDDGVDADGPMDVNGPSCATLLDAMEHPEQYADLMIRVSGSMLNFVSLTRKQQLDVINRAFEG